MGEFEGHKHPDADTPQFGTASVAVTVHVLIQVENTDPVCVMEGEYLAPPFAHVGLGVVPILRQMVDEFDAGHGSHIENDWADGGD